MLIEACNPMYVAHQLQLKLQLFNGADMQVNGLAPIRMLDALLKSGNLGQDLTEPVTNYCTGHFTRTHPHPRASPPPPPRVSDTHAKPPRRCCVRPRSMKCGSSRSPLPSVPHHPNPHLPPRTHTGTTQTRS